MAIRALSGVIFPGSATVGDNRVTINFTPHARTAGTANVGEMADTGPAANFTAVPCKSVSLRQIKIVNKHFTDTADFIINDTVDTTSLTVRWIARDEAFIGEISYMVIGNVPDGRADGDDPIDRDE